MQSIREKLKVRSLKVQGRGHVSAEPDLVTLSFDIEAHSMEYAKSLHHLNKRVDALRNDISSSGLDTAELRTGSFSVRVATRYENDVSVFDGYYASHRMRIELPLEKELLNEVLLSIAKGHSGAEFNLSFSVRDKAALRKKALEQAVQEARGNAEVLAAAAGVKLGKLIQMDYGWAEVRLYEQDVDMYCESASALENHAPDIEPEEVTASDNVTLVYEIEG